MPSIEHLRCSLPCICEGYLTMELTASSLKSNIAFRKYSTKDNKAYKTECVEGGLMPSTTVSVSAVTSFLGFLINIFVTFLVLSRGRKKYHYLFAGIPLMLAIWDIGIVLCMIRNSFTNELPVYGYVISLPCVFLPALITNTPGRRQQ